MPPGLVRRPGLRFLHGSSAGSATNAPGDFATSIASAMGSKSARLWTELLFTNIFIFSGSTPPIRYKFRSSICDFTELTTIRMSSIFRQATRPREVTTPCSMGPSKRHFPSDKCSTRNVACSGAFSDEPNSPPRDSVMFTPITAVPHANS